MSTSYITYGITICHLLGCRLLKSVNIPSIKEQLVKATVTDLKFEEVKFKLMKIFSDNVEIPTKEIENLNIKSEPTFYSHQDYHENPTSPVDDQYNGDSDSSKNCNEPLATYYTQGRDNKKSLSKNKLGYRHPTTTSNQTNSKHLNQPNCRSSQTEPRHRNRPVMKTRHSVDKNDLITRCAIRQSTNHWAQWCPERNNQD